MAHDIIRVTEIARRGCPAVTRRRVLHLAFWTSISAIAVGAGATIVNTLFPRGVTGFGGPVVVETAAVPKIGDPPKPIIEGRFLLVNLAPGEGLLQEGAGETAGGLVALYRKCPHLGCTVPWRSDGRAKSDKRTGFFICPCHGSTYTKAGVRVFGPSPRSMDTMPIERTAAGIVVQTGEIVKGDADNASRGVPWMPS